MIRIRMPMNFFRESPLKSAAYPSSHIRMVIIGLYGDIRFEDVI